MQGPNSFTAIANVQELKPRVWIVIPTFNRCDVLLACLESLATQSYRPLNIIVVDDGSSDGTLQKVKDRFPAVHTLSGNGHCWWSGSMNIGLAYLLPRAARDDFVLSFNDDVLVEANYIDQLMKDAQSIGSPALIGSRAVDSRDRTKTVFVGTRLDWAKGIWKGSLPEVSIGGVPLPSDSLPGRGTLIPRAVFDHVGVYDAACFPQYFGDEDLALRAKSFGYKLYVSDLAVVQSHVEMTGTGRHRQTLKSFLASLFSIRSPNQLKRRIQFILRHCPPRYRLSFILIDIFKVVTAYHRKRHMRA